MARKDKTVESLLAQENWHEERKALRSILVDCGLDEAVKWGALCYRHSDSNIAMIFAMKEICGVAFLKGSLLGDPQGILVSPGDHSQSSRRIVAKGMDDIARLTPAIRAYVAEAIEIEKAGLRVDFKEKRGLEVPQELLDTMDGDADLAEAFQALTPGRQRGYVLHFADAKQSETRITRIERHRLRILSGKGMHDR